jgi:hypothetical protein
VASAPLLWRAWVRRSSRGPRFDAAAKPGE